MSSDFAYRFHVHVEPHWGAIIKKVLQPTTQEEHDAFLAKLRENLEDDRMLHRTYDFTEFFDSRSGLTMRFQRNNTPKATYSGFVEEFADRGYLFGHNSPLTPENGREKFAIEVRELGIRNECFDKYIGGASLWMDGEHFFTMPLEEILEFSIALQLRFPEARHDAIVKWPDKIDAALKSKGTSYKSPFDHRPGMLRLEKEDPEFFLKHGRPQVATTKGFPAPYFENECAYYSLDVEMFTPDRARRDSRLAFTSLFDTQPPAVRMER